MPVRSSATGRTLRSSRESQKVEVLLEPSGDDELVALRYSTYVEGLGWCTQKTIRLDAEQLDDLQRALTVARRRVRRGRDEAGELAAPAKVIQLPSLS